MSSTTQGREGRLVGAALRCYPARWRRRHGDEAADLAALLVADGTPSAAIAWSYLLGDAREWLTPPPGRSLSTVTAALLAAVIAETVPARAAGTTHAPASPYHSDSACRPVAHVRSC
jgi:hypothetical protein